MKAFFRGLGGFVLMACLVLLGLWLMQVVVTTLTDSIRHWDALTGLIVIGIGLAVFSGVLKLGDVAYDWWQDRQSDRHHNT